MPSTIGGAGARRVAALLLPVVLVVPGCRRGAASDPAAIQIALNRASGSAHPAYVSVTGLAAADLAGLRGARLDEAAWESILKTTVAVEDEAADVPAVRGRYAITDVTLTFTPLFPFDPGRSYRVVFDPSRLPQPRASAPLVAIVALPAAATEPTTVVRVVHPSSEVVPENLLRMYIEFSAPMGNSGALDFVKLIEADEGSTERIQTGAFLPVEADFWSPDHTRYTLFFDPGRVKDDILPNRERGRPLRAGHRYVLDIDPAWRDANGLPLKAGYRHVFRAGPAVDKAIALSEWTIAPPPAGTTAPLTVTFPRPLDHGILVRALNVETRNQPVAGTVSLAEFDTRWSFAPAAPWQPGDYNLVAWAFLEDPQGNQIGRPFEVPAAAEASRPPDAFRVGFTVPGAR